MNLIEILDLTFPPQAESASAIFQKFDSLGRGGRFLFYIDHDPEPLYCQLLKERGHTFGWRYLKKGPDEWEVLVSRNLLSEAGPLNIPANRKAVALKRQQAKSSSLSGKAAGSIFEQ